jgi:phage/plasmid-like protein (TIGR03299 family)
MEDIHMSILDQILANAERRSANIVSEQHDVSQINWVAGMSDPGEMIFCGGFPELRRHAGEQDREYAARITPLIASLPPAYRDKIMQAGAKAAIGRASLDTTTGKVAVMVAGKAPWHGLGVNVREAVTSQDAIRLASLDWSVNKVQLQYRSPVSGLLVDSDQYAVCRMDSGDYLGSVGSVYTPFQNSEGFAFLDSVIGEFGARYESAGSLYGGRKVWMLVHLPRQAFAVNGAGVDRMESYAIFTNAHDGTGAAKCFPTSERVVCANTLRMAMRGSASGISIRHTGDLSQRVASAKTALGLAVSQFQEFKVSADHLVHTKVEPRPFFEGLLDAVLSATSEKRWCSKEDADKGADVLAAAVAKTEAGQNYELLRAAAQRRIDSRKSIIEDILERYESPTNGIGGMRGTGWAAFNAVTESADHGELASRHVGKDKASRRFESVIAGPADTIKQIAFEQVMTASKA